MQGCFFSALTCVLVFIIGSKMDRRVGLLSWLLLSLDPISIRFALASLDVTSLFFASLSILILLRTRSHTLRPYMLSGIMLGLAGLCKYSAYPIVLGTLTLILLGAKAPFRSAALKTSLVVGFSLALLILGNPLFWPSQLSGFSGSQVFLEASIRYTISQEFVVLTPLDWFEPALRAWNTPYGMFYLSMFAHSTAVYPFPIFQFSYLPWLFLAFCLGSLLQSIRRRRNPTGLRLESLLWFLSSFLFFWLLAKSQGELYYSVWLGPPLAIFSASSIIDMWRKPR
jgi:hypothetical protein